MKREHLKSNMKMVRQDIESMLDNIESIKGPKHRHYVEQLLLASQVIEASMLAISHIQDDPILKTALRTAVQQNISGMLSIYHATSGFTDEEMRGLMEDGDNIISNFKSSASAAVQASRKGYSISEGGEA
jgi:hypothetical protein